MNPTEQLAHFSGATNDLSMTGLWYSHKRVAQLVEAAKAQAWADMAATLNDRADMLEHEGNHPCEVRECRMLANAYRTYAEGVGVPAIETLRKKILEAGAALTGLQDEAARLRAMCVPLTDLVQELGMARQNLETAQAEVRSLRAALDGKP